MPLSLPVPVAGYFDAANAAQAAQASLHFALDATVADEDHIHTGTAEIAAWVADVTAKYACTATPTAVREEHGRTVVTATVAGNFPGSPIELDYAFRLSGDRIAHLEIA
jgi:hypothetical protein